MSAVPQPEFSRPFSLETLGHDAVTRHLEASPAECAALAKRFGLIALERLEANVTLRWRAGGQLTLEGRLKAAVVQRCVVSLEPVPQQIDEPIRLTYSRHAEAEAAAGDEESGFDADAPDPLQPGDLDLGEEVAQALSLALDPYPRAPGATLAAGGGADETSPFAALKALKRPG